MTIRFGACGHPLHPIWGCRLCPLGLDEPVRCYTPNSGRIDRAKNRWGSTPKKRRSANSYRSGPPQSDGRREIEMMDSWLKCEGGGLWGIGHTRVDVRDAHARICPESSRTIRFRHVPLPRGVVTPEPMRVGAPLPFETVDELEALLATWGNGAVNHQAALTQNTIAFGDFPIEELYPFTAPTDDDIMAASNEILGSKPIPIIRGEKP